LAIGHKKGAIIIKKFLAILITLASLLALNYSFVFFFNSNFVDFSFLSGIIGAVVIKFFNSSGSFTGRHMDMQLRGTTGLKQEIQEKKFTPTIGFYTAIGYTVFSVLVLFIYYKDYFIP
jgi:hypothetical protein